MLSGLVGSDGFRIDGALSDIQAGLAVSVLGDLNGDGFADLAVGAPYADQNGTNSGSGFIIFGSSSFFDATFSVTTLDGTNGFRVDGANALDEAFAAVSGAGDVNGDGLSDGILGAPKYGVTVPSSSEEGAAYVGFGSTSPSSASGVLSVEEETRIDGEAAGDRLGEAVTSAGDVNGDGFDDLLVGAPYADQNGTDSGASYVVFGSSSFNATVAVSTLNGTNGFRLDGVTGGDQLGSSVSSAGDLDGDGIDDFAIGAPFAAPNSVNGAGSAYVVFGSTAAFPASLDLSALNGSNGFRLDGDGGHAGDSLAAAGDFNADGFDDLLLGAPRADNSGTDSGSAYVVFGGSSSFASTINLASLNGSNGFRIDGAAANDLLGTAVSTAGDVNGDGFDDLLIGATQGLGPTGPGVAYVIFGGTFVAAGGEVPPVLNVSMLNTPSQGIKLEGVTIGDETGRSVSGGDDINGDGFDDLIIGAPLADNSGANAGSSYVVFGGNFTNAVTQFGSPGADTLIGGIANDVMIGHRGSDTLFGNGGADSLRGGGGDDFLTIGDISFRHVDGGAGEDTLRPGSALSTLDLTTISDNKIEDIEIIDLGGSGPDTLTLQLSDLLNLSGTSNTLKVLGDADDAVSTAGQAFISGGQVVVGGFTFNQFTLGQGVLLVDLNVDTSGIP